MTDEELAEIEKLHAATTPGEWLARTQYNYGPEYYTVCSIGFDDLVATPMTEELQSIETQGDDKYIQADSDFITKAHNTMPALVAEIRRLRAALVEIAACPSDSVAWVIADAALKEQGV